MQLDAEKVRSLAQASCVTPQHEEKRAVTVFDALLSPIAQMADIGFKAVLLEQLNQKWKQKHF